MSDTSPAPPFGIPGATPTLWDRFWALVDQSGGVAACWPWRGYKRRRRCGSRGKLQVGGRGSRTVSADRLALALATDGDLQRRDPVTDQLLQCCHACGRGDAPVWCVNPRHEYWGTSADNARDKRGARVREIELACAAPVIRAYRAPFTITADLRRLQVCESYLWGM